MNHKLALLGTSLATMLGLSATAPAVPLAAAQVPSVRVWVEEDTDLFYPGDPVRLRFHSARDAYVALVHLDTEGSLELLFPSSPWRDELVRGGRTQAASGAANRLMLGRAPGIGYFYLIASPYPLDLRVFRSRPGGGTDAWGLGRVVRGDPFWVLEELTHLLVRDPRFAPYAVDVFSYHVGGRHRYPTFACYQGVGRLDAHSRHAYYPSCGRVQQLLVSHPHYYDTRRFRGDRGSYLRELDDLAPRHGFKEPVGRAAPPLRGADGIRGQGVAAPPPVAAPEQEGGRAQPAPATPARQRPTLERRPPAREAEGRERPQPERERPEPRETPQPREVPAREAPPREPSPPPREQVRPERSDA
jgi:hypothetical protein